MRRIDETFPLAGDLLDGRTFWTAVVLSESSWPTVLVWERTGGAGGIVTPTACACCSDRVVRPLLHWRIPWEPTIPQHRSTL